MEIVGVKRIVSGNASGCCPGLDGPLFMVCKGGKPVSGEVRQGLACAGGCLSRFPSLFSERSKVMKSVDLKWTGAVALLLITVSFLLAVSGGAFAQVPMKDVLKEGVKGGAMEMLGVKQPVQGQAEMMDGAKLMMDGRRMLKDKLVRKGKIKEGAALEGELMMSEGYEMMVDGDKLLQAQNTAEGKKKMLDGARMMKEARNRMTSDLARKGMIREKKPTQGELMMNDGEDKLKSAETLMLK